MNSWDDQKVRDALARTGKSKVVVSGLWTEVCNNSFAFSAMTEGATRSTWWPTPQGAPPRMRMTMRCSA